MIQTFSYRTEMLNKSFYHTIHSADVKSSVDKWIRKIEELQNEVYSFDKTQVENIRLQFLNNEIKTQLEIEPFFLVFKIDDASQVVNIDKVNKGQPDFVAKIRYLATEEGGRKTYAISGYRPHVKFGGKQQLTSGEQLFIDKEKVFPGETVTAEIRILSKDLFKNYLFVGQHFQITEVSNTIGHGEVLEIINPDLRQTIH